jgi:5-methylcytosine-specific restriction endonuclease McrA
MESILHRGGVARGPNASNPSLRPGLRRRANICLVTETDYARSTGALIVEVLQLDVSGRPQSWLSAKEAAVLYASDAVAWTLGDAFFVMRGGFQRRTGLQSRIEVHPIIAVRGAIPSRAWRQSPALSNPKLFVRDRHVCAYCGGRFPDDGLTREHIVPTSRGGLDSWMNCITACRTCNGNKGNRLPEEARMSLLYLPYVPSLHEDMILRGRRILADQMEFLLASVPRNSRLRS